MSSWLSGGLKSSLSSLKDQVTSSIKDVLEEFEEDETDNDLLDEGSGRDAQTRLLMAVDRLREIRQTLDDQKKENSVLKTDCQKLQTNFKGIEEQRENEAKQFKELLKDKEEEIALLSERSDFESQFKELNDLLNAEKMKNEELKSQLSNDENVEKLKEEIKNKEESMKKLQSMHEMSIEALKSSMQIAVEENNQFREDLAKLQSELDECKQEKKAAQDQFEEVQLKLEEFSNIHEENSNLVVEKLQLENEVSKLRDALDNNSNERQSEDDAKMHLENECSELKEKMDGLLKELGELRTTENALKVENERISGNYEKIEKELSEKNEELRLQKNENEKNAGEYKNALKLEKDLKVKNEAIEAKTQELDAKVEENRELKQKIVELEELLKEEDQKKRAENDQKDGELIKENQELMERIAELEGKFKEKEHEKQKLDEEITNIDKEKLGLEDKIVSLQEQLKEKSEENQEFSEWKSKCSALQSESEQYQTEINNYREQNEQLLRTIENLKSENENLESELNDKTENSNELRTRCESLEAERDSNDQETAIQVLEAKVNVQAQEIEAQDKFINCLKDKNSLLEKYNKESIEEAEEFQKQLKNMQSNLEDLEQSLIKQTEDNEFLRTKLNEALEAKASVDDLLKTFHDKSAEHESNLLNLQNKLENLSEADKKANEYKDVLDQQQAELDQLKEKLQLKDETFNDMKQTTDVYKQQYEGLLEEYQQYLQDLEILQAKSENLEKWKKVYEDEITELKSTAEKHDVEMAQANARIKELTDKEEERLKLSEKVNDLEMALSREKKHSRDLKEELSDKELFAQEDKEKDDNVMDEIIHEKEALVSKISLFQTTITDLQNDNDSLKTENQNMRGVLQEKNRENGQIRGENARLMQTLSDLKNNQEGQMAKVAKDKDLEIEALKSRNESLVTLVQANSNKSVMDNTNEILILKKKISDLEEKLSLAEVSKNSRRRFNSESKELKLKEDEADKEDLNNKLDDVQNMLGTKEKEMDQVISDNERLKLQVEEKVFDLKVAQSNIEQLKNLLQEKSANSESQQQEKLMNIAALQELQETLAKTKKEKDDIQIKSNDKDRQLAELRREVNNVIDKKKRLEHELERLKQHLMEVEEGYTQEALEVEDREQELRKKLQVTEEALRLASTQQSNTTKVATVHLQKLEAQVTELTRERDQLKEKTERLSHEYTLQSDAMDNLDAALKSFQSQKENEMKWAEKDFDEKILIEKKKQDDLLDEIDALKQKVANANEGLAAANRLSEQLEKKTQAIAMLKHEVKLREDLLKKAQNELKELQTNTTVKVDRYLVKNLVVGYVNADNTKKREVLKIIATVLDFNQDEREKTGLLGGQNNAGWLSSFFAPQASISPSSRSSSEIQEATGLDLSLAQAFVTFLQNESTPKQPVKIPLRGDSEDLLNSSNASTSSGRSTPTSALPTLGVVNPNFANSERSASASPLLFGTPQAGVSPQNFSVNRSSSSILRQVLQEEKPGGGNGK